MVVTLRNTLLGAGLRWNQTGTIVAGTGTAGSAANQFDKSACIYIDANNTMYICDHHNSRIQMWVQNATSGVTIAGTGAGPGATALPHPEYLTFDKNGYMYVSGHVLYSVQRFPPNSPNGSTIAGTGSAGNGLNQLDEPTDMVVDDDLNLYVVDMKNKRVMKWGSNATAGIVMISDNSIDGVHGMVFAPQSSNQVYLSDANQNGIYLWTFGAATPNLTLTQVNSARATLNQPWGLTQDRDSNLFVADKNNDRVVMFCANSTVGIPVVGETGTSPVTNAPMDVAFDSDSNLYVVLDGNVVIKYTRI